MIKLLAAIASTIFTAAVSAAPITYNFTGVVDYNGLGGPTGQTASGSITVDPFIYDTYFTDGSTYKYGYAHYYDPVYCPACTPLQTNPLQTYGAATDGSSNVTTGGGDQSDEGFTQISRKEIGVINQFYVRSFSRSTTHAEYIYIHVMDFLGASTQIFDTPTDDLSLTQDINWMAAGATHRFAMTLNNFDETQTDINMEGYLTSVTIAQAVPEPATLALIAIPLALVSAGSTARRRASLG